MGEANPGLVQKFQNELELVFNQTKDRLIDELFKQTSNDTAEVYCYFYANLVNKLSSNGKSDRSLTFTNRWTFS